MKHNQSCIDLQAKAEAYKKQWPNYCKTCNGNGVVTWQENQSPLGSGQYWPETFRESCHICINNGICPRCHGDSIHSDEDGNLTEPCTVCGWTEKNGGCPEVECWCRMQEES